MTTASDDYEILFEEGPYGHNRIMIHKSEICEGWIGKVPIGRVDWYQDMPVSFGNEYCPMRGSKRGIAARNGDRVYEYEYQLFERLGEKMGAWMKRNNKKFAWLRATNSSFLVGSCPASRCANRAFLFGLVSSIDKTILRDAPEKDFIYAGQRGEILFALDKRGMSNEQLWAALDMLDEIQTSCYMGNVG